MSRCRVCLRKYEISHCSVIFRPAHGYYRVSTTRPTFGPAYQTNMEYKNELTSRCNMCKMYILQGISEPYSSTSHTGRAVLPPSQKKEYGDSCSAGSCGSPFRLHSPQRWVSLTSRLEWKTEGPCCPTPWWIKVSRVIVFVFSPYWFYFVLFYVFVCTLFGYLRMHVN